MAKTDWVDDPTGTDPNSVVDAAAMNALGAEVNAKAGSPYLKTDVTVDNVPAVVLVDGQGQNTNGFVFKANAQAETGYGQGQAFMVLEEGVGDATIQAGQTGSVMFRVDRHGSVGFTGTLHVATGLRHDEQHTHAAWIDPVDNLIGLIIDNPSAAESATWDQDFFVVRDVRTDPVTNLFRIRSTGDVESKMNLQAQFGKATQTYIGNTYGFAGIAMGTAADTLIYRADAGILGLGYILQFAERADPAAPGTNNARLYARDNGAGKTQLCVRFPTGAVQVIATEP